MDRSELQKFIEWYWKEIDGKPSSESSLTIAEYYIEDMRNSVCQYPYHNKDIQYLGKCEKCNSNIINHE